jgi:hypothetical protein
VSETKATVSVVAWLAGASFYNQELVSLELFPVKHVLCYICTFRPYLPNDSNAGNNLKNWHLFLKNSIIKYSMIWHKTDATLVYLHLCVVWYVRMYIPMYVCTYPCTYVCTHVLFLCHMYVRMYCFYVICMYACTVLFLCHMYVRMYCSVFMSYVWHMICFYVMYVCTYVQFCIRPL